jgi:VanZ family protein
MPGESDKLAHGLAFLALAGLADFAYPRQPLLYKLLPLAGYGLALELAQGLLPYREASFLDWLADAAGLAAYASLAPLLRRRRRSQPAGRGGVFLK